MHLHLPKAIHGWREFAKEVGIIVLGVLIALGFEQVAQAWHWHHEASATRDALVAEVEYSALWADERLASQRCLRDRIAHLVTKLNSSSGSWTADPLVVGQPRKPIGMEIEVGVPLVYRAPHRPWLTDEWETAKSSGVIDHFDRRDARNLEFIYRNIAQIDQMQDQESTLEPQISYLGFDQSLAPQSRVQALVTLARLDYLNGIQAQSAAQLLATLRSSRLPLGLVTIGPQQLTFEAARKHIMRALRDRYGSCVVEPRPS